MEKTDYPMELKNSEKNVLNYYGISCEHNNAHMHHLPDIEDEIRHLSSKLGNCKNPEEFVSTLCLLVQTVKNTPVKNKYTEEILLEEQMRRRDLLNLLILCKTTRDGDNIIIKNRSRNFKLNNGSNWIVKAVDDILARELGNVKIEDAVLELNKTATGHRGRRAKDPQMLNIIWGTYLFVSDMYYNGTLCLDRVKPLLSQSLLGAEPSR